MGNGRSEINGCILWFYLRRSGFSLQIKGSLISVPTGVCFFFTRSYRGALSFLCDQEKKAKKSPGMLFKPTIIYPRSGQPGATPGEGLQPAVAPSLAPGDIRINRTVICRESQPAETVNEPRERAGLRGARLRPARPKGRIACSCHYCTVFIDAILRNRRFRS